MFINMFKSKVHRATVTEANLSYTGSLTLDKDLMVAAGMIANEQVHVLNINTGGRFTTYLIEGKPGSGVVCMNGAAARLGQPGDLVIVLTYAQMDAAEAANWEPTVVHVDAKNRIVDIGKGGSADESPEAVGQ